MIRGHGDAPESLRRMGGQRIKKKGEAIGKKEGGAVAGPKSLHTSFGA